MLKGIRPDRSNSRSGKPMSRTRFEQAAADLKVDHPSNPDAALHGKIIGLKIRA
jgi:hypothetical protein